VTTTLILCLTALMAIVIVTRAVLEHDRSRAQARRETAMHDRAVAAPVAELVAAAEQLAVTAAALDAVAGRAGPSRVGHRVTVSTRMPDDQTLFGVVVGDYTDRICLDDAEYVIAGAPNQPLPGRQDIAADNIAFVAVHGHVATGVPAEV
jgi:hypothetical protein